LDKAQTQTELRKLVKRFQANLVSYESSDYLERQLQTDFLDDLFKVLGWDVTNKANLSPRQREVLVEKGDTKGRPDYSFRVNGADKFFVEAKSPNRGTEKPEDIFQAKRYGYSTRSVNIAVLTDFKTFKVYDSGIKPNIKQPKMGLLFETTLEKMAEVDFEQIWVFQHDEVHGGSIEKLLLRYPALKRLRVPVDVTFLEELTKWRELLAKDVYKNNPGITVRSLNDVVQRILDRLIFIRLIEDREIIKARRLKDISENWKESRHRDIQVELNALFKKLNNDFNGEIFKTHDCEKIRYDSKILADIIDELYPPESPYDFSGISVEILGIIYEKYLGSTIKLTEKRLKVEEKPEVRKAGGVYYTPKWVVDYIIGNTIGELIQGKKPEQIAKLRFLDPACGSGSFLIGALQKIFDYHLEYYLEHKREAHEGTLFPKVIRIQNFEPRLSIYAKADILKNNIYGVDLDPQAVEITMMSLYIKVLEGERALPENKELLPSLSNNIRNGNSLIGFDYISQQTLDDSEKEKTNPFEWRSDKTGFGKIIGENGGFHAIVGNPPYIRIQTMREWASKEVDYITNKYKTAKNANYDIYVVFVEKAIELLDPNGLFGYILPHKFFQAEYGENLRRIISENKLLKEIISFKDQQVFDKVTTYTCLLFLSKMKQKKFKFAEIIKLNDPINQLSIIKKESNYANKTLQVGSISLDSLSEKPWQFGLGREATLMGKLNVEKIKLKNVVSTIFVGLQTSADPIFIVKRLDDRDGKLVKVYSKSLNKNINLESNMLKPLLKGQDIKRYSTPTWKYWIIFPYIIEEGKAILIPKEEMELKNPKTWDYLNENKKKLLERDRGKLKVEWYAFGRSQNIEQFSNPKIMMQVLANRASLTLDKIGTYYFVGGGNAGGYGIKLNKKYNLDLRYVLALLNSKILDFYLQKISTTFRGGFYSYAKRFIEQLPIHIPENNEIIEYNEIISLVDKILELNKNKSGLNNSEFVEREIAVYEEKIDEIVFKLYNITDDEKLIMRG
jgi:type I restriction-modification system DNA methylase subunit